MRKVLLEVEEGMGSDCVCFCVLFQENIFEWQFVICGPVDTEFEVSILLSAGFMRLIMEIWMFFCVERLVVD